MERFPMAHIPTISIRISRSSENRSLGILSIGDWEVPCTIGSAGLVNPRAKREGDKRTPIGIFPLRYGFFNAAALPDFPRDLTFPFVPMTADMIWEEEGRYYNRLVFARGEERSEDRLSRTRDERLFDVVIPIGYNDSAPEPGRGSALFIHAARRDMSGTAGCIGVPQEKMAEFIRRLEPGMVIDIAYADGAQERAQHPEDSLEAVRFMGLHPGPKLLVIGAVHGNEPCGPQAIERAIADCRTGNLKIRRGEVTFVPIANLKAYRQRTREGDRNLNRDLRDKPVPENYEDAIGNRICALLREHDVLLDIHSFRGEGEPFVFAGPPNNSGAIEPFRYAQPEGELAVRLGTETVIHGWLEVYDQFLKKRASLGYVNPANSEGVGTTEYMRFSGGYGVTLECGSHDDPASIEVGYSAILKVLAQLQLIDAPEPPVSARRAIHIIDVLVCEVEGDHLTGQWKTGDPVEMGQALVQKANGETIAAPRPGFIIFPNENAMPGDGLCYFGVESERMF
ncbi:L,D-transpeptidase family protein [Microvirga guangxiensis]|uniref:L,D-peptidoglycan transpeptidase YkuD, ErfK/YbiS/YcfS/YnhG family n=1 Tax=Microvirga guangxiensis TaxID=549386 RepID=A0A1G5J3C1_9HYPH|nr:succinylglutamate desuccinylase/aspartoacylase family protein [Microvirga guangxiensis]SCY82461.1 L,D-peptidoglycan transpeptidase YkuD, ErfK/YbiS/YcfS/YnhG family [Microvirga guangxiensis]